MKSSTLAKLADQAEAIGLLDWSFQGHNLSEDGAAELAHRRSYLPSMLHHCSNINPELLAALWANLLDNHYWQVYCGWLKEQGEGELAEAILQGLD